MSKPIIGITSGDINGIGIEIIIKVFSEPKMLEHCTPVIFASNKVVNFFKKQLGQWPINYTSIKSLDNINPKQVNVYNCWEDDVNIQPGQLTEEGGRYALVSLQKAVEYWKDGQLDILVTSPIHKNNTQTEAFKFVGHTPYLKETFGAKDVGMMLYNEALRVALLSEHIAVKDVAQSVTRDKIVKKVQLLNQTLIRDFGIDKPKIAVLGLNPHAGDEGLIGQEEAREIIPAVQWLVKHKIVAMGPFSPDAYFAQGKYKKFDLTLAMYHDQGLIPFKTIAGLHGVNYTCGLPKIRTSPDHGVAFDIAGKGVADEESLRYAVFEGIDIFRQRLRYDKNTAHPLVKNNLILDEEGE